MTRPGAVASQGLAEVVLRLRPRESAGRFLAALLLIFLLGACGGKQVTHEELTASYRQALEATESRARADWDAHPGELAAAVDRIRRYFGDMTPQSVTELTDHVYAEDAYLNDTLHDARGLPAIKAYFLRTIGNAKAVRVRIVDVTVSGPEVYTRWEMTIEADALAGGRPVTSPGMTHFRLDRDGRVLLHKDYWDSAGGFFEHVPVLGWAIRKIRGRL